MSNYYVSQDKNKKKWRVKKENSSKVSTYADTQKEAEKIAKKLSANSGGGEVRIKGLDGNFRDSDTVAPGNDPYPPKDKKY